ncbi:MAG: hypothetical protein ACLFS2_00950 [Halochromatium sp.]|uniref:hypothetical protein n=1 Tax=Halochromatium sp. TaxID=2049430 RepID=UPI00397B177B
MKTLSKVFLGSAVALYAAGGWAGNRELMAENAEQLIRLSDAVAETIEPAHAEGRYRFSARVVGQVPTHRASIDALRWTGAGASVARTDQEEAGVDVQGNAGAHRQPVVFMPSLFTAGRHYQSLISIGSIPAPVIGLEDEREQRPLPSTPAIPDGAKASGVYEHGLGPPTLTPGGGRALKAW